MNPNNDPVLAWHIRRIREIGGELREAREENGHLRAAVMYLAVMLVASRVAAVRPA